MKIFKKAGFAWLLFLVFYCSVLISAVLFICQLGVSVVFYLKDGKFLFLWENALDVAFKKGCITGLILGLCLWLKASLQEQKNSGTSIK